MQMIAPFLESTFPITQKNYIGKVIYIFLRLEYYNIL